MILTLESRSCSRKHRTKTFNAAFDAEYAGKVAAGTIARFDPVLVKLSAGTRVEREARRQYHACFMFVFQQHW